MQAPQCCDAHDNDEICINALTAKPSVFVSNFCLRWIQSQWSNQKQHEAFLLSEH